jgi:hypothetical protein
MENPCGNHYRSPCSEQDEIAKRLKSLGKRIRYQEELEKMRFENPPSWTTSSPAASASRLCLPLNIPKECLIMRLLHYLEIENFKRFGDKQHIKLDHPRC